MILLLLLGAAIQDLGRIERRDLFPHSGSIDGWPLGCALAAVGDVDGDGVPDFAVSTPQSGKDDPGRVWLISGSSQPSIGERLIWKWCGERPDELFGMSMAAADLDCDGVPDVVVGAPGPPGEGGCARAFSGKTGAELARYASNTVGDDFGWSVDAGDLDGDGTPEIAVGAPSAADCAGAVWGFKASGELRAILPGGNAGERFGWCIDASADFDGDGARDLAIGAPALRSKEFAGRVLVHSLAKRLDLARLNGEQRGESFGFALAALGDIDGDSRPDLAVGAPAYEGEHPSEGRVSVFTSREWKRVRVFAGHQDCVPEKEGAFGDITGSCYRCSPQDMRFGHALVGLPDLDGDGSSEICISAPKGFYCGRADGWVTVISSKTGDRIRNIDCLPRSDSGLYGTALDVAGDLEGDGVLELFIGSPGCGIFDSPVVELRGATDGPEPGSLVDLMKHHTHEGR